MKALIAAYARSPQHFARKGPLAAVRPDTLAAQVVTGLLERTRLDPKLIEDVILGCAYPEGPQGSNPDIELTRFLDSLPVTRTNVPKLDLQPRRFFLGRIPTEDARDLDLVLSNPGKGTLQGTVTVTEGADWLSLAGGGNEHSHAGPRVQDALAFQLGVGASRRVGIHNQGLR